MVSCIVGSWLLSRNREFRFSRIGEIRRIDGNLISRERTTALKDFAYIYVCITPASVCVYVYNGKMFVSRADSGGGGDRRLERDKKKPESFSFYARLDKKHGSRRAG